MNGIFQMEVGIPGCSAVHLHIVDLDALYSIHGEHVQRILSEDEKKRAGKFRKPEDRQRFTTARYFLRTLLARTLEDDPERLRFAYNPFGKPYLECGSVNFNLSHSGSFGVIVLSRDLELGVDIETNVSLQTAREVAPRILSKSEYALWRKTGDDHLETFTRFWILKEALLKASGKGLSQDPQSIEIDPDQLVPGVLKLPEDFGSPEAYGLHLLSPPAPFPMVGLAVKY